jgi:hypothetical protein
MDASCNEETLTMAPRKTSRTKKPVEDQSRTTETTSRVRNSEVVERARDLERPPPRPRSVSRAGTLATVGDTDQLPVVESGMPVEPEELGVQFLRDATEQDNFESDAPREEEPAVVILPHIVISEATLDASMQEDGEWLESNATGGSSAEVPREPFQPEVDLTQTSVSAASLFDQIVPDDELGEDELDDAPVEGVTMEPKVHTEDPSDPADFAEARDREIRRIRNELLKKRQRAEHSTPTPRGQK